MNACFLIEFALIPYTIFLNPENVLEVTWTVELIIDILHVINMTTILRTATKGDGSGPQTEWNKIALAYFRSHMFYIDIIGTFPTLVTTTTYRTKYIWFYYFKILRYFDLQRVEEIIGVFVMKLKDFKGVKKQALVKLQYLL